MSDLVTRFSVSLPEPLLLQLDSVVELRGLPSRSHAIAEMIQSYLLEHAEDAGGGSRLMAGVITVVYSNEKNRLRERLHEIQSEHIDEVISSQHVLLEEEQSLEAILVQGPAKTLKLIADQITACKGVKTVKLALTAALIPPLHNRK